MQSAFFFVAKIGFLMAKKAKTLVKGFPELNGNVARQGETFLLCSSAYFPALKGPEKFSC